MFCQPLAQVIHFNLVAFPFNARPDVRSARTVRRTSLNPTIPVLLHVSALACTNPNTSRRTFLGRSADRQLLWKHNLIDACHSTVEPAGQLAANKAIGEAGSTNWHSFPIRFDIRHIIRWGEHAHPPGWASNNQWNISYATKRAKCKLKHTNTPNVHENQNHVAN